MWLFWMLLGFVGFLAAMFGLIARGFDRDGHWQRQGWRWLLIAATFFAMWVFSLPRIPRP